MKLTKEQLQIINDALVICEDCLHNDARRLRKAGLSSFVQRYGEAELNVAKTLATVRSIAKDLDIELEPYDHLQIK